MLKDVSNEKEWHLGDIFEDAYGRNGHGHALKL
jgi:hypothetical protein